MFTASRKNSESAIFTATAILARDLVTWSMMFVYDECKMVTTIGKMNRNAFDAPSSCAFGAQSRHLKSNLACDYIADRCWTSGSDVFFTVTSVCSSKLLHVSEWYWFGFVDLTKFWLKARIKFMAGKSDLQGHHDFCSSTSRSLGNCYIYCQYCRCHFILPSKGTLSVLACFIRRKILT